MREIGGGKRENVVISYMSSHTQTLLRVSQLLAQDLL